jgi:hypothetical protein
MTETVNHPAHYGGEDNPYEVIKVIEAWGLGFKLGQVLKYIGRPTKGNYLEDLKKARWYLNREITMLEGESKTAYHAAGVGWGGGGGAGSHGEVIEVKPASRHNHHIGELCGPKCPGWHRAL